MGPPRSFPFCVSGGGSLLLELIAPGGGGGISVVATFVLECEDERVPVREHVHDKECGDGVDGVVCGSHFLMSGNEDREDKGQ